MAKDKRFPLSLWLKLGLFFLGIAFLLMLFALLQPLSQPTSTSLVKHLRQHSRQIKGEMAQILLRFKQQKEQLPSLSQLANPEDIYHYFERAIDLKNHEGLALYRSGQLTLWRGEVINLEDSLPQLEENISVCVKEKSSVYLVHPILLDSTQMLIYYRLLSFHPQFKSSYLDDYQFFSSRPTSEVRIDYWDFREDVSGFENFFSRYQDEYLGQPRLQGNIQSLFFPLRNEKNKILATVTLNSPPPANKYSRTKSHLFASALLLFLPGLICLAVAFSREISTPSPLSSKLMALGASLGFILGSRAVTLLLARTYLCQNLSLFSPAKGGFLSWGGLTQSPLDIFLTSLAGGAITLLILIFYLHLKPQTLSSPKGHHSWLVLQLGLICLIPSGSWFFTFFLQKMVAHINLNLLTFRLDPLFIIFHFSIFLVGLSLITLLMIILHYVLVAQPFRLKIKIFLFLTIILGYFFYSFSQHGLLPALTELILLAILAFSLLIHPKEVKTRILALATLSALILVTFTYLYTSTNQRSRRVIETSLSHLVLQQSAWGKTLLQEATATIDEEEERIRSFLLSPRNSFLAQNLWEKTPLARFNWYSRLEIIDAEGVPVSYFSLNVPEAFLLEERLPVSPAWQIMTTNLNFFNERRPFLIAYRDFFSAEEHLGRVELFLSLDPRNLPFLYSANPYFELLRSNPLPSLIETNFFFVILDNKGHLLFNPHRLNCFLSPNQMTKYLDSPPHWESFYFEGKKYWGYLIPLSEFTYAFFLPQQNLFSLVTSFLKTFILYIFLALFFFGFLILVQRPASLSLAPSFSTRVYLSFLIIALIPMVLFTLTSKDFFHRVFSQKITENTENQARFAQKIMEDYFLLQPDSLTTQKTSLPETLVSWISSAISSDVNLYQEGRLIASSRRDFFDYGLLPELLDGEVYYRIRHQHYPLVTQKQKIGRYSFRVLTTAYSFGGRYYLLSLPFPLETEELNQTSQILFEFFLLISFFFIIIVAFLARALGQSIIHPIQLLLQATKEISMGNLEVSIYYPRQDEMKTLIDRFNFMVKSLKQHQQELAEMSRKAAWAEMARKVAHEIKNPLTPIQLSAEHILRVYQDKRDDFEEVLQQSIAYITSEVDNLRRTAQEFLELAREASLQKEPIDLKVFITNLIEPYQSILEGRISFHLDFIGDNFTLEADPAKLRTALRNLLTNAIEAISGQGNIWIKIRRSQKQIVISIKDSGRGIPPETLKQIFDLYFSTKEGGTGLGLPIARKIIEEHGGQLKIDSEEFRGTEVVIILPTTAESPTKK